MDFTNIERDKLLTKLRENRETHSNEYIKARKKWRAEVKKKYVALARAVRETKDEDSFPDDVATPLKELPKPQQFLNSYDLAIARLEVEVRDVVELDERDFQRYWLNDWEWRGQFAASTQNYIG
jgi:hypothetical protein